MLASTRRLHCFEIRNTRKKQDEKDKAISLFIAIAITYKSLCARKCELSIFHVSRSCFVSKSRNRMPIVCHRKRKIKCCFRVPLIYSDAISFVFICAMQKWLCAFRSSSCYFTFIGMAAAKLTNDMEAKKRNKMAFCN